MQTVCTEKITHGLPNHRFGHFIAARLLWAAGYAQGRYMGIKKGRTYESQN